MALIRDGIDFEPLLKARANFEDFKEDMVTKRDKAGAIQAFEYTYELSWKTMRKLLLERGKEFNSPREVFRAAALEQFIVDPEQWFVFLKARNLTVHTYDEADADAVIAVFTSFSKELTLFLKKCGVV
jgi:nucleotidyltransferase substrate binding protein (TIGR01987 family)